ncbi:hypothetical protein L207DRAFT_593534 [Hyaloscypha variabilis F]|uniref:Uncharacterized protein n=1 Tax=Hyaloscypha variabilis (strain UAMH 11265 / GT02V1 / F) TaxID=1149755 RepID=A0A2J6QSQ4_HYAVF|nr:hypothetical protein L207DRAFT_593534 [Hyaloscypha variabilis F]
MGREYIGAEFMRDLPMTEDMPHEDTDVIVSANHEGPRGAALAPLWLWGVDSTVIPAHLPICGLLEELQIFGCLTDQPRVAYVAWSYAVP